MMASPMNRSSGSLMDLHAAAYVVLGRVDVTAGVQAHVHAAHDLASTARGVVLFEHFHLELHVLLEACGGSHREILRIELKADVDDSLKPNSHTTSPQITKRILCVAGGTRLGTSRRAVRSIVAGVCPRGLGPNPRVAFLPALLSDSRRSAVTFPQAAPACPVAS